MNAAILALARTSLGRRVLGALVEANPEAANEALAPTLTLDETAYVLRLAQHATRIADAGGGCPLLLAGAMPSHAELWSDRPGARSLALTATEPARTDLIFVEGERGDLEGIAARVTPGGHLVLHNADPAIVAHDQRFRRVGGEPGTLAHFQRR